MSLRRGTWRGWLGAAVLIAATSPAHLAAQPSSLSAQDSTGRSNLTVYLMTMGPGPEVWERFGHNAIWIHDPVRGTDFAYNYGIFDFRQEDFLLRFAKGHMRYWMAGKDAERSAADYMQRGRSLWVQELNLTVAQRAELQRFLEWNRQEENKFYDYNYYGDNCSTRVRDALDRILGGGLKRQTESPATEFTFRDHTRRLLQDDILVYLGIMLGLGQPVDRPITAWEAGFLPVQLQESLRDVTVSSGNESSPLVLGERTLYQSEVLPEPISIPRFWPRFGLLGLIFGGAMALLGWKADQSRVARGGFFTMSILWSVLVGGAGILLAFLWWFTDHATSAQNENVLHANPIGLGLAVALLAVVFGARWARPSARWLAVAMAGLSLLGLVLKVLPAMHQVNGEVIVLLLPAHIGLALGAWLTIGRDSIASAKPDG
ncbi:MAG: DUF4105 domain-containing protein [Gemmatimonadales bacterium]|nr:DUF4105 domain-containing protein [Gemmatimonadales bacterium]